MAYLMYLRKSRADLEAEAHGEGETLERHRKALLAAAKRQNLPIGSIYEEIVSGDTIAARPVMQQVLQEVEQGLWEGVLVMEVERLARGDTIDQGIVAQTFKYSGTKIITPQKNYDATNEFDEEYFEFGLFMSRREYKTINRRLQGGRAASAREGNFVGSIAPYGYEKYKLVGEKGYSLRVVPENAKVIKKIFELYTKGLPNEYGGFSRLGLQAIARYLNKQGYEAVRHDYWQKATIKDIITNPAYCGKIRWGYRKQAKRMVKGKIVKSRPIADDNCILVDGKHKAIISEELWELANNLLKENPAPPIGYRKEIKNSLAGLIVCKCCGRKMTYRAGRGRSPNYLVCHNRECKNVSTPLHIVEKRVMEVLKDWLKKYKVKPSDQTNGLKKALEENDSNIKNLEREKEKLKMMLNKTFEAYEQGIYNDEQFLERSSNISNNTKKITEDITELENKRITLLSRMNEQKKPTTNPKAIMEVFEDLKTPGQKNDLLKKVVEKFVYHKEKSAMFKGVAVDDFELEFYPKLPQ